MKLWYFFVALILVLLCIEQWVTKNQAMFKGKAGERRVKSILATLPADQYTVLNDVLLNTSLGTTQIDHIVVSVYGIFVIETKNYSGIISGSESGEYWTQNIYGHKNQFKNPIHQNYGHVKAIEGIISRTIDVPIYSVVVFDDKARIGINVAKTDVTYVKGLKSTIQRHCDVAVITQEQMKALTDTILANNIIGSEARSQHAETAHSKKESAEAQIRNGICTKCGGTLMIRHGKYGDFYGCSNYPKCHFTKQT